MKRIDIKTLVNLFIGLAAVFLLIANTSAKETKIIRLNADSTAEVLVDGDGQSHVYTFHHDDLSNLDAIENQLYELDDETKEKVMQALSNLNNVDLSSVKELSHNIKKIMVIGDDGKAIDIDNFHTEFLSAGDGGVKIIQLKNRSRADAIKSQIDAGELTQEQLDIIQSAVDAQR